MSSKIMVAAAIMAAGSFLFVDTADAQRGGGGAERGGNANAEAGGRRGGARQNRGGRRAGQAQGPRRNAGQRDNPRRTAGGNRTPRRNGQTNQVRAPRATPPRTPRAPRHANRGPNRGGWNFDRPRRGWMDRFNVRRAWRNLPWVGRGYRGGRSCTAVARTHGGDGRALRGTYGDGFGRRACRKALNACNLKLDYRQAQGRNPYARCVIASR